MMIRTLVHQEDKLLGEVEIFPTSTQTTTSNTSLISPDELMMMVLRENGGIRINQFSQPSDRCQPLAVLHSVSSTGVCFKMEEPYKPSSTIPVCPDTPLYALHSTCLRDKKTAVMFLGEEELHLVAMRSRRNDGRTPCFWGFLVRNGLYNHCLVMLNLRCLGIVFDLDETLIVANTLRSFEDRIENLQRKINLEVDQQRITGMMAEVKRYQDDKAILKQYAENDQVIDDGKVIRVQSEAVPALSDSHQPVVRPLIRLQDKNIVLTRINPLIRDTSVLVRLRPAWDELRSYLIARGRKRFEVYVCTMAERDYALEMWRLLDPDANLISTNELLNRIVCVKNGSKKSLFNVFHGGVCDPKMALVIDDRLKVWDERDQARVHVVPAFAPYYAPQAEANNTIPVLCVARNVACNVRGSFFKEFDDGLLQQISDVLYEDDHRDVPSPPDVSSYLVSEDDMGTKEPSSHDGMADAEVERRLKEALSTPSAAPLSTPSPIANFDQRLPSSQPFSISAPIAVAHPAQQTPMIPFATNSFPQSSALGRPLGALGTLDLNLQSSPAREEGEVPESELDPDTRRRLLILQHGQDMRDPPPIEPQFSVRPPVQPPLPVLVPVSAPVPPAPARGNWFPGEDQMNTVQLNRMLPKEFPLASEPMHAEKQRPPPPPPPPPHPFPRKIDSDIQTERTFFLKQRFPREIPRRDDQIRSSIPNYQSFQGEDSASGRSFSGDKEIETQPVRSSFSFKYDGSDDGRPSSSSKELNAEAGRGPTFSKTRAEALHDIALQLGTKVDFKYALVSGTVLKSSVEVYFEGEKMGDGTGKTRREAQHQACEVALMNLAEKYFTHLKFDNNSGYANRTVNSNDNGFTSESGLQGNKISMTEESVLQESPQEANGKSMDSVSSLRELCMMEGLNVDFKAQPQLSTSAQKDEVSAQVEIDGKVFGHGTGLTWDDAMAQAAEKALASLNSTLGLSQKRPGSPRTLQAMPHKRYRPEFTRILHRLSSSRYSRNASPVP